eukprot:COSAG01_NODE_4328_length_5129_cov_15.312724_4_plen_241_part_00
MASGAVTMDWADDVSSILCLFMPGQGQGGAVARILFGDVNPSGKTPVTMPRRENEMNMTTAMYPGLDEHGRPVPSDCNWAPSNRWPVPHAIYSEKLLVGYRWYTAHAEVQPAFAFGSGLSFTTFAYSNARVGRLLAPTAAQRSHTITVSLTNTGAVAGAEVAQLYLRFPTSAGEPPLQLKGFRKVHLRPGTGCTVAFEVGGRDLSIFGVRQQRWVQVRGTFVAWIGGGLSTLAQQVNFTN